MLLHDAALVGGIIIALGLGLAIARYLDNYWRKKREGRCKARTGPRIFQAGPLSGDSRVY
jgi:hypothetical protein